MLVKKNPKMRQPPDHGVCPSLIVGVGTSTIGLSALEGILAATPPATGLAFVVAFQQGLTEPDLLASSLGRRTSLTVQPAQHGVKLAPNHVYTSIPGHSIRVSKGRLWLADLPEGLDPSSSLDLFFRSLAGDQGDRAVAIILSGSGTDGLIGLKAIRAAWGIVIALDTNSIAAPSLPTRALAAGLVDCSLNSTAVADYLQSLVRSRLALEAAACDADAGIKPADLQPLLRLLLAETGHDFSPYKANLTTPIIERRITTSQSDGIEHYLRYAKGNWREVELLASELLIGVTSFFRGSEAYEVLAQTLEQRIEKPFEGNTFRAWVPGCSSGEEAYSVAIVIRECLDWLRRPARITVFATDPDRQAISKARTGLYPHEVAPDLGKQRLRRFFDADNGGVKVGRGLRETVLFSVHNLLLNPSFTQLDLLSCRNVLIYLNRDSQKRLIEVFHAALNTGGVLFLGASEGIGTADDLFETIDAKARVFSKRAVDFGCPRPIPVHSETTSEFGSTGTLRNHDDSFLFCRAEGEK